MEEQRIRKPEWLKVKSNTGESNQKVVQMLKELNLHTVCEEANCPNIGECFCKRTVTFMILGKNCTRNCRFCNVTKEKPTPIDPNEPLNVARAIGKLALKYVVITSVTRDDLPDGGAAHFASVINTIRAELKEKAPIIEVLIPDFKGNYDALNAVIAAKPEVIGHNIETVKRLYPDVRPMAVYERSLEVISRVSKIEGIAAKSGIMLGLGEKHEEVIQTFKDLREVGCNILTVGQYLAPSKLHISVKEYITPQEFEQYKNEGLKLGFEYIASSPLVRSSYMADAAYNGMLK